MTIWKLFKTWDGPYPLGTSQNMRYFIDLFGGSTFFINFTAEYATFNTTHSRT